MTYMHPRFPVRLAWNFTRTQHRLEHLMTLRLQKKNGATFASAKPLLIAHYGLLTGYEPPAKMTDGILFGLWGTLQINGQSTQPCRTERSTAGHSRAC